MQTVFTFQSDRFPATGSELDEDSDDYINPDIFAKELSLFMTEELAKTNYPVQFECIEDWGRYHEVKHPGDFKMSFGCSNYGDGHLIQVHPQAPHVRKLFKKIPVQNDVEKFVHVLWQIIENTSGASHLEYLEQ